MREISNESRADTSVNKGSLNNSLFLLMSRIYSLLNVQTRGEFQENSIKTSHEEIKSKTCWAPTQNMFWVNKNASSLNPSIFRLSTKEAFLYVSLLFAKVAPRGIENGLFLYAQCFSKSISMAAKESLYYLGLAESQKSK